MQELRSTEILDKEIQADARRKVENILKKADADCQALFDGVDEKVAAAQKDKENFYSKKLSAFANDLNAAIPLEKQRFEVSYIQDSIIQAINEYLKNLSEEKRLELVIRNCDFQIFTKKINAYIYGFDLAETKKLLANKLGSNLGECKKTEFGKVLAEDDIGLEKNEGIILESDDKSIRCRLTLVEVFQGILDKNRAELAFALFGTGGNK